MYKASSYIMLRCGSGATKTIPSLPTPAPPRGRGVLCSRGCRHHRLRPRGAKKQPPDELERGEGNALARVLLRSGAALFALGFVDAGYSGDWSRIGAISKDTEELLKLGAYAVVPLCLAIAFSVSEDSGSES